MKGIAHWFRHPPGANSLNRYTPAGQWLTVSCMGSSILPQYRLQVGQSPMSKLLAGHHTGSPNILRHQRRPRIGAWHSLPPIQLSRGCVHWVGVGYQRPGGSITIWSSCSIVSAPVRHYQCHAHTVQEGQFGHRRTRRMPVTEGPAIGIRSAATGVSGRRSSAIIVRHRFLHGACQRRPSANFGVRFPVTVFRQGVVRHKGLSNVINHSVSAMPRGRRTTPIVYQKQWKVVKVFRPLGYLVTEHGGTQRWPVGLGCGHPPVGTTCLLAHHGRLQYG